MILYKRTIIMFSVFASMLACAAAPKLKHVHPLNWWSGMQTHEVQVMLHGAEIGACDVQLAGEQGVKLLRVERVENPNYLFVYIDVNEAPAQTFNFCLMKQGKKKPYITQPYELKERSGQKPDAFGPQDVLYLLMPDRFINANPALNHVAGLKEADVDRNVEGDNGRHGGDLAGIASALDYLQDLGVTAIWPTPVQTNDQPDGSYHGYAITNYYEIDPRIGTNDEYRALVADCHRHGIKMVMDLVFNHCGSENFLFTDLPQHDWFNNGSEFMQSNYRTASVSDPHASHYDRTMTVDGWFVRSMPDFNQQNPLVKDYLIQTAIWWVEFANIDGIRQDTYPYADREMMAEWNLAMEREWPGFNIVGETWIEHSAGVAWWQKDSKLAAPYNSQLRSVMDFPLMRLLNSAVDEESDDWNNGLSRIYTYLSGDGVYANTDYLLTFLGNHDTDRFQHTPAMAAHPERYEQALLLLLTLRGIPQLYYADELGESGTRAISDGLFRQDFPTQAMTAEGRTPLQERYHAYTRRLLNWRKQCAAAQRGKLVHFACQQGCYVYSRELDGKRFTVIMNGTSKAVELPLANYREVLPASSAHEVLTGKPMSLGETLKLAPRGAVLLEF